MNSVEKIEAAIAKLEALARPFSVINGWLVAVVDQCTCAGGHAESNYAHEPACGFEPMTNDEYAAVMQATVAPQLAILRAVLAAAYIEQNWQTLVYTETALALADAILGADS